MGHAFIMFCRCLHRMSEYTITSHSLIEVTQSATLLLAALPSYKLYRKDLRMKHLSRAEAAVIKARIVRGDKYVEIASDYRINQGRIADLKFHRIFADVIPANLSDG